MAGYSRIYCVGGEGGFMGVDGVNPILFQVWVGDADRQWLKLHPVHPSVVPLAAIERIIPKGPDHEDALLDACIACHPAAFASCRSLTKVRVSVAGLKVIDFHLDGDPDGWSLLREEARPIAAKMAVWRGDLERVEMSLQRLDER